MTDPSRHDQEQIDAVITWVDGQDPAHQTLRQAYIAKAAVPLQENAVNPHRWADNDEILYCLRSIEINAPWIRRIWIVTDGKMPDLSDLSGDLRRKVGHVLHADLFEGFADALPTFNSLAIESLIWRIPDLTERFIYLNDDFFLTKPLSVDNLFVDQAPVLRGRWDDFSALENAPGKRDDPTLFYRFIQINAARCLGFPATRLFHTAHVAHPMLRSVMAKLYDRFPDAFHATIGARFRNSDQVLPQGLHNHACIAESRAVLSVADDHLHIKSGFGAQFSADEMRAFLTEAMHPDIRFLCVNDLPQLEAVLPEARDWLMRSIGAEVHEGALQGSSPG